MKFLSILLLFSLPLLFTNTGCGNESEKLRAQAEEQRALAENAQRLAEKKLAEVMALREENGGVLNHLVMLNLKDGLTTEEKTPLMAELEKLGGIQGVLGYEVGSYKELDDPRALSDYELVLKMAFRSQEDYKVYQQDSTHLAVRASLKPFLAGPPATYDFVIP